MPTSLSVFGDRNAGNFVLPHHFQRVADLVCGRHGDRIDDHAAFRTLHLIDFIGLLLDGQVAMNDAKTALLRQRDCHVRFGHRVHGGADDGNIQADIAGELRLRMAFAGITSERAGSRRTSSKVRAQEQENES